MAKKEKKKKSGKRISLNAILFAFLFLIFSIIFIELAVFFLIAMLPTIVVYFTDMLPGKNKTFTVGAMNFTGCFPYLLMLWSQPEIMGKTLQRLLEPETIIVIYLAAALGYVIYWVTTKIVSILLVQKSKDRIKAIEREKEALINRWGKGVAENEVLPEPVGKA